ncbi:hypothetical protein Tco_1419915 [Tanacetum coccineum]
MSLRTTVHAQMSEIIELQSADRSRRRAISDLLETDRGRREEMRELRAADRTRQQQIIQTLTVTALAARDATRNGTDSHSSGTGVRGSERVARECTYQDFMKCKPLYFKGTEGVVLMWSSTTQRFQELAILCVRMFPEEADKIERYHGGNGKLENKRKSKTLPEAIEFNYNNKVQRQKHRQGHTLLDRGDKKPCGGF